MVFFIYVIVAKHEPRNTQYGLQQLLRRCKLARLMLANIFFHHLLSTRTGHETVNGSDVDLVVFTDAASPF